MLCVAIARVPRDMLEPNSTKTTRILKSETFTSHESRASASRRHLLMTCIHANSSKMFCSKPFWEAMAYNPLLIILYRMGINAIALKTHIQHAIWRNDAILPSTKNARECVLYTLPETLLWQKYAPVWLQRLGGVWVLGLRDNTVH